MLLNKDDWVIISATGTGTLFALSMVIVGHISTNPSKLKQHPQTPLSFQGILACLLCDSLTRIGFEFQKGKLSNNLQFHTLTTGL